MNVFRLCNIINSLYGQVAGDLETCSKLWRIMSPPHLPLGATWFATAVNKFPSPLLPDRTTNNVYIALYVPFVDQVVQHLYSPVFMNVLILILYKGQNLKVNTPSNWPNQILQPIRSHMIQIWKMSDNKNRNNLHPFPNNKF